MYKKGILWIFMALAVTFSGFSDDIKVKGTAPTFTTNDPFAQQYIEDFNRELRNVFNEMIEETQRTIDDTIPQGFNSNDLLKGFGTAAVFASHGATVWAYADYKLLSISTGVMLGLKFPGNSTRTFLSGISGGGVDINSIDDLTFGINPQFFSLHAGLNPSALIKVFPKNLFLGLRLGFFGLSNVNIPISDITSKLKYRTFTIGLTTNYQLLPSIDLVKVIKWRGVNIGSGLIFQTTKLDFTVPFGEYRETMDFSRGSLNAHLDLVLNPTAALNMNINTVTIPVEISTAIKLVFLNIPLGLGFDLGLGKSKMSIGMKSDVNIDTHNNIQIEQDKKGSISASLENAHAPTAFNFKIMTGLGFTIKDRVIIDIPVTFYIKDGYNLGFTLGVRF